VESGKWEVKGDGMERLPHAGSYRELIVYQKARNLSQELYHLSLQFPREERYSLTDQMRRSVRSIGAQVAESWGKRRYERHFVSKLTDADSEQYETQHWIDTAVDCGYLTKEQGITLCHKCQEINRLINGMINKAHKFCQPHTTHLREEMPNYFID
jgi:four helix bundle protein